MKFFPFVFLLLAAVRPVAADVLDDFERDAPNMSSSPAVKLALADAPVGSSVGSGKALAADWALPHGLFIELNYAKPIVALQKEPEGMMALKLEVWQPAAPSIIELDFRMLDARGEIFQWGAKLPRNAEAGWRSLTIPIDAESANAHWAGNNNGRIEYPLQLFGYSMVFANAQVPAGRAFIDQVRLEPVPKITLETDRFPNLVNATVPGKCDLVISNPEAQALSTSITGKLTPLSGVAADISGTVEVPANGVARFPVPLGDRQKGYWALDCQVKFGGAEVNFKSAFVVADPLVRVNGKQDFIYGIVTHTEALPADEWERDFQAAAAAGASVMRVGPAWSSIERKPGEYNWDVLDRLVDLGAKYGIELDYLLGFPPSHAISAELQAAQTEAYKNRQADAWKISLFAPPEDAPWRRFVSAIATRYKGKIRLYEVWNEPDLGFWQGTTEQYQATLRAAYQEVHKADPNALVLTGGFATVLEHAGRAKNPDLQERVLKEASDSFDIHAMHQHGPFLEFEGAVNGELRRIRAAMPHPKPLYFNETALAAFGNEKQQALTVVKKMAFVMAQGAIGYNWYDLRNDGINPTNAEHNYGLLTTTMRPKSDYATYLEFVRRTQGMRPLGTLDFGPARRAYAFGGPRGRVVVWWTEGQNAAPVAAMFRTNSARVVDIMGNAKDLPVQDGVVLAQPDKEPRYLELPPGQGMPELVGELVRVDGPSEAAVGQPLALKAVVTNPLARAITANLSWVEAGGKKSTPLVVPARSSVSLPIAAAPPGAKALTVSQDVAFTVEGTPWAGYARYSVPVARTITSQAPEGRPADWVLDKRWDIVSLTNADPALAAFLWKDPNDFSASIWLWRQANSLRVRVDVKDDIHVQKEKQAEIWKDDSVQIAFQGVGAKDGWEIGAAQAPDGSIVKAAWAAPAGVTNGADVFGATCSPIEGGLRYEFDLPCDKMGLDEAQLKRGLRFNLLVNDNDGTLRESFTRVADGLGIMKDVNLYPVLKVDE